MFSYIPTSPSEIFDGGGGGEVVFERYKTTLFAGIGCVPMGRAGAFQTTACKRPSKTKTKTNGGSSRPGRVNRKVLGYARIKKH